MDSAGDLIADLQAPPGPPPDAYSALVANYSPTGDVLMRMLDTGVDQFFGSANDLVVPSEGGWRVDQSGVAYIPAGRIGCYGPGGNLAADSVTHVSFFSQPETVHFIAAALAGQAHGLSPVDTSKSLPDRRLVRSVGAVAELVSGTAGRGLAVAPAEAPAPGAAPATLTAAGGTSWDTFHLIVLPRSESKKRHAQILAHYGSARVLERNSACSTSA